MLRWSVDEELLAVLGLVFSWPRLISRLLKLHGPLLFGETSTGFSLSKCLVFEFSVPKLVAGSTRGVQLYRPYHSTSHSSRCVWKCALRWPLTARDRGEI